MPRIFFFRTKTENFFFSCAKEFSNQHPARSTLRLNPITHLSWLLSMVLRNFFCSATESRLVPTNKRERANRKSFGSGPGIYFSKRKQFIFRLGGRGVLASILFIFIWGGGYLLEKNIFIHKIFYENQEFLYNLRRKIACLMPPTLQPRLRCSSLST